MPYIHFTEEQKQRANNVDLVDFLRFQGEELARSGHEYRWLRHDSVTVRGNRWYRHSMEQGGHAIDFVQEFYNLSFPDAVTLLLEGEQGVELKQAPATPARPKVPFALPEPNSDMRRVYAYLMKQRYIDPDIISHFAKARTLYEDARHHNAVFVGLDENGQPAHAHKRSTYSMGSSYRSNVEGSNSRYGFSHIGKSDWLYVFEAPIDLLSFLTLHKKGWQDHSYLALNGVSDHSLFQMLQSHPHIRQVGLCLDNDKAGLEAANRISEKLKQMGYEDTFHLLSRCKDWNEQLQVERSTKDMVQQQTREPALNP